MEIVINGNKYEFENESFSTYSTWGHKSRLFKNDELIGYNKCNYQNRTWESYQYQSCMRGIVWGLLEDLLKESVSAYKEDNSIKRLKKSLRLEVERETKVSEEYKELHDLLNKL